MAEDQTAGRGRDISPYRGITTQDYDKKAREFKQQQTEIGLRIEQHQKGDDDYRITLESLISLASRAVELFERSKAEEKEPAAQGKKLEFSLRSPFDLMVKRHDYSSWLAFLNTVRMRTFEKPPAENGGAKSFSSSRCECHRGDRTCTMCREVPRSPERGPRVIEPRGGRLPPACADNCFPTYSGHRGVVPNSAMDSMLRCDGPLTCPQRLGERDRGQLAELPPVLGGEVTEVPEAKP